MNFSSVILAFVSFILSMRFTSECPTLYNSKAGRDTFKGLLSSRSGIPAAETRLSLPILWHLLSFWDAPHPAPWNSTDPSSHTWGNCIHSYCAELPICREMLIRLYWVLHVEYLEILFCSPKICSPKAAIELKRIYKTIYWICYIKNRKSAFIKDLEIVWYYNSQVIKPYFYLSNIIKYSCYGSCFI